MFEIGLIGGANGAFLAICLASKKPAAAIAPMATKTIEMIGRDQKRSIGYLQYA
jgi:hypothetical protein